MKTKFIISIPFLSLLLMSFKPLEIKSTFFYDRIHNLVQDLKIIGIYDGNEGYGYNFITNQIDDGSEYTMTFQKIDDAVLKEFDLGTELFLNQKFEVTYTVKNLVTKDENGFDEENEIYTIRHLLKVSK